ncbi:unnamed protein product, partial [Orchesella dallaii]
IVAMAHTNLSLLMERLEISENSSMPEVPSLPKSEQSDKIPNLENIPDIIRRKVSGLNEQQLKEIQAITKKRVELWLKAKLNGSTLRRCLSVPPACRRERLSSDTALTKALDTLLTDQSTNFDFNELLNLSPFPPNGKFFSLSGSYSLSSASESMEQNAGLDFSDEDVFEVDEKLTLDDTNGNIKKAGRNI